MGLTSGLIPSNIVYPKVRVWLVRVKGESPNPAFGSLTSSQSGTITGARFTAVVNPLAETASVPVFERIRLLNLDGKIKHLRWEWNRFGGCGAFTLVFYLNRLSGYWGIQAIAAGRQDDLGLSTLSSGGAEGVDEPFGMRGLAPDTLNGEMFYDDEGNLVTLSKLIQNRYEVEVEVDLPIIEPATPNWQTVYRGTIDSGRVLVSGRKGVAYSFSGYGLVRDLQKLLVGESWEKHASGADYSASQLAASVIVNHVVTRSRILWDPEKVSITAPYVLDNFYAEGSALRAIQTLAFLQHRVEWGVDADGKFYFMDENKEIPPWNVGLTLSAQNCAAIDREIKSGEAPTHVVAIGYDGGAYVYEDEAHDSSKSLLNQGTYEKCIQVPELKDAEDLETVASNYIQAAWEGYGSHAMNTSVRVIQHSVVGFLESSLPMLRAVLDDDMHGESIFSFIDSIEYQIGSSADSVLSAEGFDVDVAQGYGLTASYILGRGYFSLAQEFEARDQPLQALLSRQRQKRFPGLNTVAGDLPDGNYSGEIVVQEVENILSTLAVWLTTPDTGIKGWYPMVSLIANVDSMSVGRNVSSLGGVGASCDPSTKDNDVAYFSQSTEEDTVLQYSGALPTFGGSSDLAVVVVPRFSLPEGMSQDANNGVLFKMRFVTVAVGESVGGYTFQERNMLLTAEDLLAYSTGELIQRFGWILFNRDLNEDSEFQMYLGRYGTDPRDNYTSSVEMYTPKILLGPFRATDLVKDGFVDGSRVGVGTSGDPYFTDYAGLLGLPSRRP